MAAKQCWSSNRIGQTCSVPQQEILSHWPTILLPEKALAVPLRPSTALNESFLRRHSERSARSEESLLRFRLFGVFLRGFPAGYAVAIPPSLTKRFCPAPAAASRESSARHDSRPPGRIQFPCDIL